MKLIAQTRIVTFRPYPHRAEQCTVGLLVWLPDASVQAYPAVSMRKARAIDPSCDATVLREGLYAIAAELTRTPDALPLYQSGVGAIRVAVDAGLIDYATDVELREGILWTLNLAVEPHKPAPQRERVPVSRLFMEIKQAFSAFHWVAEPGQTLEDHKIVPRHPLSRSEGLTVDFALRNGALHCMQTMDYRTAPENKRIEATAKLLTLGYAAQFAGEPARRYAILAGASAPEASTAVKLAHRTADDIFITESSNDMNRLFNIVAEAMGQPPFPVLSTQ
jgi:hypothetical protein